MALRFVLNVPDIGVRQVNPTFSTLPDGTQTGDPWDRVAGPWSFEFDLAIAPGTVLSPAASATAHGVTATLESILISPTTVRLKMSYAGLPDGAESWTGIATVLHDGKELAVSSSSGGPSSVEEELTTLAGTDSPSGAWAIRIDEIVGFRLLDQTRLQGPWQISFVAP